MHQTLSCMHMRTTRYTTDLGKQVPAIVNAPWLRCALEDEQQLVLQAQAGDETARDLLFYSNVLAARHFIAKRNQCNPARLRELSGIAELATLQAIRDHRIDLGTRLITLVVLNTRRMLWQWLCEHDANIAAHAKTMEHRYAARMRGEAEEDVPEVPPIIKMALDAPVYDDNTDNRTWMDYIEDREVSEAHEEQIRVEWYKHVIQCLQERLELSDDQIEAILQGIKQEPTGRVVHLVEYLAPLMGEHAARRCIANMRHLVRNDNRLQEIGREVFAS